MSIYPRTNRGAWSCRLLGIGVLAFVIMNIMVVAGQTGGATFSDNYLLAIPGIVAAISIVASAAVGAVSVWKDKERSGIVYAAIFVGSFIAVFVLVEVAFPH